MVERVLWALDDPVASRALAEAVPIFDEVNFPKIESWLEIFQQEGWLCCAAEEANPDADDLNPAFVRLVDSGFLSLNPQSLDTTRAHFARWIARHLHVPQVLGWALRAGGHLHPGLGNMVRMNLSGANADIPPRLRLLWTILSSHEPKDPHRFLWSLQQYQEAHWNSERRRIEEMAIAGMAPRLIVVPGPSSRLEFGRYYDGETEPIPPIDACGHPKLVVVDEESWSYVEGILNNSSILSRHAEMLTGHLECALTLGLEHEEIPSNSSFYRPSIVESDQNRHHGNEGFGHLIDLGKV